MSELNFDYEFKFTSGSFDSNIYNLCTLPDTVGTRLNDVKNIILKIQRIFIELPGLHIFSTFLQNDQYRYKITVNNINWN
jgi:hypothetical protein